MALRVMFTNGSQRDIDAESFMCPEGATLFRVRNPKDSNGQPPENRFRVVETIKSKTIRNIEIIA